MNNRSQSAFSIADAYVACHTSLKRYIARFLYQAEDIEDIAQESFLRAYNATLDRENESPKAYLLQVAKTMALKEL